MSLPARFDTLTDLAAPAREAMGEPAWDYVAQVAEDGLTQAREARALEAVVLRQRVLVDVDDVDTSTSLLGHELALPVLAAPTAMQGLAHADGEAATVVGCAAAGTVATVSSGASRELTDVGAAAREAGSDGAGGAGGGPAAWWFQLYPFRDRELTAEVVGGAVDAGASALVLTVDVPVVGQRRALHPDFDGSSALYRGLRRPDESVQDAYARASGKPLTWDELAWLADLTDLPLLVKGVLDAEDAGRLADAGVDAIVVSSHGGRQLDGAPAPIEVLPAIVEAVAGRCPVLADGSVRRGSHVLKLLARGADAALVGRPVVWGLACDGAAGVQAVFELLQRELATAMALTGCATLADVGPHVEWRPATVAP